ncbi:AAA family ATPase [Vibrio sp. 10N.222.55.E8]
MLERIQKIENVGNYSNAIAGGVLLGPVSVIYGENRNGKSTLCDILYSLSLNEPQLVLDRKSIIQGQEPDTINQLVQLKFSDRQQAVKFINSEWDSRPPEESNLYIFDHGFIHRNVMAGTKYSRENSTNVSGFILGENVAAFDDLETRNQQLRTDRQTLASHKRELEGHEIGDFATFVGLPVPTQTLAELDADIQASKLAQEQFATQITNTTQITQRANLNSLSNDVSITAVSQEINDCLALSMVDVHDASKAIVTAHKNKVNNKESFNGWAASGVEHLDEDCPFCGQELGEDAQLLIHSYRTAFDDAFQTFVRTTKTEVTRLRAKKLIDVDLDKLTEKHEQNIATLKTYSEDSIKEQLADLDHETTLAQCFESVTEALQALTTESDTTSTAIGTALADKYDAPYNAIGLIGFDKLQSKVDAFNSAIQSYTDTIAPLNAALIEYKNGQDGADLTEQKRLESVNEANLNLSRKRLSLDALCVQYNDLSAQIIADKASYDTDKEALEQAQETFLNTYFTTINDLFRRIGSRDFEISRKINRGGTRTIYDLEVKFKRQVIDNSKLHCLFSESDRRALALCIFLAKIQQLSADDKAKAILIMDDPVTSFDSERISSILHILFTMSPSIKQMVITTHYKGMASAVMTQFDGVSALKIVQTNAGSNFVGTTKEEMTATAHDERYTEIMDFVERRTQENQIGKLRLFIEDEMRQRYKLPLIGLNLTERDSFNDCINALEGNDFIDESVATSLHSYRNTLNQPAHILAIWSLEDSRAYAEQMMDFIYQNL